MKRKNQIKNTKMKWALVVLLGAPFCEGVIIWEETFETDGEGDRYTTTGTFSDGEDDYYVRTNLLGAPAGMPEYTPIEGDWFMALEDVDAPENLAGVAEWEVGGIAIGDYSSLRFQVDMAAGSTNAFDLSGDGFEVQFRVDGGDWATALAAKNNGETFNSMLRIDTDLNGLGDDTILLPEFQRFQSGAVAIQGAELDIRMVGWSNSASEAIAFDNLVVMAVPEPATISTIGGIAALLITFRNLRRRRHESRA